MFITKTDLSASLYPDVRDLIARFSEAVILEHCAVAESEVESYLAQRYNIRPELEKAGAQRNKLLVAITRDIAIYRLYHLAETIPNIRVKAYDDAIRLLNDIATSKILMPGVAAALPAEEGTPGADYIGHGSRPPRAPLCP